MEISKITRTDTQHETARITTLTFLLLDDPPKSVLNLGTKLVAVIFGSLIFGDVFFIWFIVDTVSGLREAAAVVAGFDDFVHIRLDDDVGIGSSVLTVFSIAVVVTIDVIVAVAITAADTVGISSFVSVVAAVVFVIVDVVIPDFVIAVDVVAVVVVVDIDVVVGAAVERWLSRIVWKMWEIYPVISSFLFIF